MPMPLPVVAGSLVLLAASAMSGCMRQHVDNPDYPLAVAEEPAELARMESDAVPLERPVVIIPGYFGPKLLGTGYGRRLAALTSQDYTNDFFVVDSWFSESMDSLSERVVERVLEHFGPMDTVDPKTGRVRTIEVDVIGLSMGGLVARHGAITSIDDPDRPILNINRLFTVSTPHRGAVRASEVAVMDQIVLDMLPDSLEVTKLNEALPFADYELIPYAILNDGIVGEDRSAPPGYDPIWVPGQFFGSHLDNSDNQRILLDIARRLRGEEPLGVPGPLPQDE